MATCLQVAIAVVFCVLPAVPILPADARPDAVALSVAVSITPDSLTARITNSQNGSVAFGGNVTVGKLPASIQRVTVTLSASCIWPVEISPDQMVFTSERPQTFILTVVVPSKTHVFSNEAIVNAHATDGIQSADGSARCTVVVGQYYKLSLSSDTPIIEIPDSPATVDGTLRVYNMGNGHDTVRAEVVDPPKALVDHDIGESAAIASEAHGDIDFTFFIEVENPMKGAMVLVTIKVTSMGAAAQGVVVAQSYSFSVYLPSTMDKILKEWPTYAGWGVGLGILGAVAVVLVRRRRSRRDG